MLKNFILPILNKFILKRKKAERITLNYKDARNIGIMFNLPTLKDKSKNERNLESLKNFVKKLKDDGKKVQGLTFDNKNSPYNFKHYYFASREITYLRSLRSESVKKFINNDFDYLFCIDIKPSYVFHNILAKSKAKCRIGKYDINKINYFELMIKIKDTDGIDVLIDQMNHYTQEL